jgi:hypothetical protein
MIPPSARIQFEKHKSASGVWNGIRVWNSNHRSSRADGVIFDSVSISE